MDADGQLVERVRALRAEGCTAKQIARTVGVPAARVTALVRAMAEADAGADPYRVMGCWVSPQWSAGVSVSGHPEWHDVDFDRTQLAGGLVSVVVARQEGRHRVSVCGYLVDTYCLGVKNTLGPRTMAADSMDAFVADYFDAHGEPSLPSEFSLAQHLVFGAVDYARGLGLEPHPDFDRTAGHLGEWTPPSAITFGFRGKPLYVQGPRDNATEILAALRRTAGTDFDYISLAP